MRGVDRSSKILLQDLKFLEKRVSLNVKVFKDLWNENDRVEAYSAVRNKFCSQLDDVFLVI